MLRQTIALLTDFGVSDPYAGILRGVIAGIAPEANVIDLSNAIPRGDVRRGAHALWQAKPYLPAGAILLCVVDPGVGSQRRAVALSWPGYIYIGPDNGLISYLVAKDGAPKAYRLEKRAYQLTPVSDTFHGRDLFAPAAAHLAAGVPVEELGPPAEGIVQLTLPRLEVGEEGEIIGEVLHADSFGNVITSLGILSRRHGSRSSPSQVTMLRPWLDQIPEMRLPSLRQAVQLPDGQQLSLVNTFADVRQGEPLAYVGSDGLLEIGVNRGDASQSLPLSPGDTVVLIAQG